MAQDASLVERGIDTAKGDIRDKVAGRGSACRVARLGVCRVHAGLASRLGKDVLDRAGIACTWETLVEEITCSAEGILRHVMDFAEAL